MPPISIVMPVLDEAAGIEATLARLQAARRHGHEVIVVDGGSRDDTAARAVPLADRVLAAPRGRASQMNAGAAAAGNDTLLFLHADTLLPDDFDDLVAGALQGGRRAWGRFDVRIDGRHPLLRIVERMMNWRSRLTGIATGDQAIFVRRETFDRVHGYPPIALMEDVALSRALRRIGPPGCIEAPVMTSGRRWERHGVLRTIILMWRLRFSFWLGADPARLAKRYGNARR